MRPRSLRRARAQSVAEPNTLTVTPFLSASFGTSNDLGSSLGIGVAVGYDLTRNLGFEGELGHVFDVAGDDDNLDWSVTNYQRQRRSTTSTCRDVTPYATFGLGVRTLEPGSDDESDVLAVDPPSSTEVAYNFGGGVKVPLERSLPRARRPAPLPGQRPGARPLAALRRAHVLDQAVSSAMLRAEC